LEERLRRENSHLQSPGLLLNYIVFSNWVSGVQPAQQKPLCRGNFESIIAPVKFVQPALSAVSEAEVIRTCIPIESNSRW